MYCSTISSDKLCDKLGGFLEARAGVRAPAGGCLEHYIHSNHSESKSCNDHANDPRSISSGGGHLLGGAANSMGAKERGPLRMGIESQSKYIYTEHFVHE